MTLYSNPPVQVGRQQLRSTLFNFIQPPNIGGLNQVFTSFPKRINFQDNAIAGETNRAAAVIFIESETETRIAVGGATGGWKRVDYSVVIQVFHHSLERDSEDAMANFDLLIDNLKEHLRSDHRFGDPSGVFVWQGAEPAIDTLYSEPVTQKNGSTETWASIRFLVTQMIEA